MATSQPVMTPTEKQHFRPSLTIALYILAGVVAVCLFATIQLFVITQTPPSIKNFIIPTIVGALAGGAIGIFFARAKQREAEQRQVERELRHKRAEQEAILQALPEAFLFTDLDRCIIVVNPAFTHIFGYAPEEVYGQHTALLYDSQEAYEEQGRLRFNLSTEEKLTPYEIAYRRKNGELFAGETVGTIVVDSAGETIGFLGMIRDITERKQQEEALRRSEDRNRALVEAIPDDAMARMTRDGIYVDVKGPADFKPVMPVSQIVGKRVTDVIGKKIGREFIAHSTLALETSKPQVFEYETKIDDVMRVREARVVPVNGDESIFILRDVTERKRAAEMLEQRVEERTHEIEKRRRVSDGLGKILETLNSDCALDHALNYIVAQAQPLLNADGCAIFRLDEEAQVYSYLCGHGLPDIYTSQAEVPLGRRTLQTTQQLQPTLIPDLATLSSTDEQPDQRIRLLLDKGYQAILAIPLLIKGEIYGILVLYYKEAHNFSDEEVSLATTFTNQTALAIENAHLRNLAEELAITKERSRIGHDLHDSVTQTLFSASVIADILPRLWERNEEKGRVRLEELRQLSRGALAEMRTLLIELRPEALVDAELGDLLQQLADAFNGRARVPVVVTIDQECELPVDVRIAFYRTTQEALNNIAKHANASQVSIVLTGCEQSVDLIIGDNGDGFDVASVPSDHFGLSIMSERSNGIGAHLSVDSQPGKGTEVRVRWQKSA